MARIFAAFGILERVLVGGMRIDRRDSLDRHGRVVMTRKTVRRIHRAPIIALLAERARSAGAELRFNSQVASADPAGAVRWWGAPGTTIRPIHATTGSDHRDER